MSASFQVNTPSTPTEFTIKIGVTIHNGTLTVQPQLMQQQQKQRQQQPMHHQQSRAQPSTTLPENSFSELLRGFNSLSMNNDPVESVVPPHALASIDSQEPPTQLNQTKRRERAGLGPHPVGIPIVPDDWHQQVGTSRSINQPAHPHGLQVKAPGGRPIVPGSSSRKLMRAPPEMNDECERETAELIFRELMGDDEGVMPSTAAPDSPFQSVTSNDASPSPPASYISVPTPPERRPRGRPRKVRPAAAADSGPQAIATAGIPRQIARGYRHCQPRPTALSVASDFGVSVGGISGFVTEAELAEAVRVIGRYSSEELSAPNERGDLLSHILAREGNWAKLVALNTRWLSNASLGDIFTSINTINRMGHTVLLEAVVQQNIKAVEYCCLFTSGSDVHLHRALVESALLPSDAIFNAILRTMCHEMDENGNPVKRTNQFIDHPIGGWSFRNGSLDAYAGLTLAQALTVHPAESYRRLETLIGCGANPARRIDKSAPEQYRLYIDCVYLAAAFSPMPFECLMALGVKPDTDAPIGWDKSGDTLRYCVSTICHRNDVDAEYKKVVEERLNPIPNLDVDDVLSCLFSCQ